MYQLSPSILAADFNCLGEQIRQVEEAGVEWLHIDVMDGAFVPSISFGMPVIASIRKNSSLFFDVHLMIEEPGRYIDEFKKSVADMKTVHAEACKQLDSTLREIRKAGMKVGVAINPGAPVSQLECVLELVDMVLVMTVNPGFGGQKFLPSAIRKAQELKGLREKYGLDFRIEIDGGINLANVKTVIDAGVEIIVAGSSVFKAEDVPARVQEFLDIFENRE